MKTGVKLFHLSVFGYYLFVMYTLNRNNRSKLPEMSREAAEMIGNMRRFSPRYLTNWTFGVQAMYFGACVLGYLLNVIPGCQKLRDRVERMSNYVCTSIATPMALLVTSVFWTFYLIDRELIFPKVIDLVMPSWINHSIHSLNAVFALIDLYLVNHKYPSIKNAAQGLLCYLLIYASCLFGTYFETGIWLYPFMGQLTWGMKVVFTISIFFSGFLLFLFTTFINKFIWGSSAPVKSSKKGHNKQKLKK